MEDRIQAEAPPAIRVTHVVFDFEGGGLESMVAAMAAKFRGTTVATSLITLGGRVGRLGAATRERFDQFVVARPTRGLSMLLPLGLAADIRRTRADVVHVHSGSWYKGAKAARLAGVGRVVYTEHGREHDDPRLMRWLDRRAAARTDVVVAVSTRLRDYLAGAVGVDAVKLRVVHNAVDTSVFAPGPAPADLRAALKIPPDALVVGSVGRLEAVKAYERLVDAAAALRGRLPCPLAVVICGDGSLKHELRARAERLGVGDQVYLPGWTDQPVRFYRLLDAFVLCSRSEGESVSLMEAMACGIPPVVTDVGASAEIVGGELAAQVVPAGREASLPDVIAATLRRPPPDRAALGAAARRRAAAHYGLDGMIAAYERLYREGLAATAAEAD
ncbi:MAG TPA: glycosyltransferase [Gemmatimonadales bacterium]|nr:glycosyltransferase [Gemmatimonadales bacterium]